MVTEISAAGGRERSPLIEYIKDPQFKRLLSEVVARQHERDFRSLAILSRYPGEGKTFFAAVLALAYATFLRRRVLILDTIVQGSTGALYVGELLRESVNAGGRENLIEIVTSRALEEDEVSREEGAFGVPGIDFGIGDFLHRVSSDYDLVIVDTCALESSNTETLDPIIVARQTEAALVVTSPRSAVDGSLDPLRRILSESRVELLGAIYNGGRSDG
ncbi:MAG: hypothetical protein RL417_927 [Pseudomonadota bacterium]|jgi:Mrp family chromosome partitioning ATPase